MAVRGPEFFSSPTKDIGFWRKILWGKFSKYNPVQLSQNRRSQRRQKTPGEAIFEVCDISVSEFADSVPQADRFGLLDLSVDQAMAYQQVGNRPMLEILNYNLCSRLKMPTEVLVSETDMTKNNLSAICVELLKARRHAIILSIRYCIGQMRDRGVWISPELNEEARCAVQMSGKGEKVSFV